MTRSLRRQMIAALVVGLLLAPGLTYLSHWYFPRNWSWGSDAPGIGTMYLDQFMSLRTEPAEDRSDSGLQVEAERYQAEPQYRMLCDKVACLITPRVNQGYYGYVSVIQVGNPELAGWPLVSRDEQFMIVIAQKPPGSKHYDQSILWTDGHGNPALRFHGLICNLIFYVLVCSVVAFAAIWRWHRLRERRTACVSGFPVIEVRKCENRGEQPPPPVIRAVDSPDSAAGQD